MAIVWPPIGVIIFDGSCSAHAEQTAVSTTAIAAITDTKQRFWMEVIPEWCYTLDAIRAKLSSGLRPSLRSHKFDFVDVFTAASSS